MSEAQGKTAPTKKQRPVDIFRERRGGMSDKLKEYVKEQARIKRSLKKSLKDGPKTIPQLAAECDVDPSIALWHLMAIRRYGEVSEAGEQDGYILYMLKEG